MQSKKEHLQQFLSAAIAPNGDRLRATSKGQFGCFVGFRESGAQPLGPGSKMIPLKPSPLPINEPAVEGLGLGLGFRVGAKALWPGGNYGGHKNAEAGRAAAAPGAGRVSKGTRCMP